MGERSWVSIIHRHHHHHHHQVSKPAPTLISKIPVNKHIHSYAWNDRRQFGQLIGTFQGMQHQLAQSYTEIVAARALVYNAARKKEAGEDFVMDAAMAKLFSSQVAGRVSGSAIEWMGGMGFVREGLAEKYWRDSKIGAIYEGTSNIQLTTIGRLLQGRYTR